MQVGVADALESARFPLCSVLGCHLYPGNRPSTDCTSRATGRLLQRSPHHFFPTAPDSHRSFLKYEKGSWVEAGKMRQSNHPSFREIALHAEAQEVSAYHRAPVPAVGEMVPQVRTAWQLQQ